MVLCKHNLVTMPLMMLQKAVVVVPMADGAVTSSSLWHPSRVGWCSWALVGQYQVWGNVADVPRPWWSLVFWQIVHSLDSWMPIFLKWAARQPCSVLSLKFATTSFLGLPLYSAHIWWISLHFLVVESLSCFLFVLRSYFAIQEFIQSGSMCVCFFSK
jgi:hypothetical protein